MKIKIASQRSWRSSVQSAAISAVAFVAGMALLLPVSGQENPTGFQPVELKSLAPSQAVIQLRKIMGGSVEAIADDSNHRVLLRGEAATIQIAKNYLRTADGQEVIVGPARVRVTYQVPASKQAELTRFLESIYTADAGLQIARVPVRGELIIDAPETIQSEVAEVMSQRGLRRAQASLQTENETITETRQLRHMNYRELEAQLVGTWGDDLRVQSLMQGQRQVVQLPQHAQGKSPVSLTIDRVGNQVIFDREPNARFRLETSDQPLGFSCRPAH